MISGIDDGAGQCEKSFQKTLKFCAPHAENASGMMSFRSQSSPRLFSSVKMTFYGIMFNKVVFQSSVLRNMFIEQFSGTGKDACEDYQGG